MDDLLPLPKDLAACRRLMEDLIAQVRDRDALLEEQARAILALQQSRGDLQRQVDTLPLTLDKLLRQISGRRSERFLEDPTQQKFDFGDDPQAEDTFRDAIAEAEPDWSRATALTPASRSRS